MIDEQGLQTKYFPSQPKESGYKLYLNCNLSNLHLILIQLCFFLRLSNNFSSDGLSDQRTVYCMCETLRTGLRLA